MNKHQTDLFESDWNFTDKFTSIDSYNKLQILGQKQVYLWVTHPI